MPMNRRAPLLSTAAAGALAAQVEPNTPEQFQAFVLAEMEKWGRVAQDARIQLD